jgi:hypothetical protein
MKTMENVNEIVSRLNQGESLENIASELTTALNEAKRVYDAQQEASAKAIEARRIQKREELEYLVRDALTWIKEYYPDLVKDVTADLDQRDKDELFTAVVDAVIEAMDKTAEAVLNPRKSLFGMNPLMLAMMGDMPMLNPDGIAYKQKAPTNSKKSDDDILNEFLGKICH